MNSTFIPFEFISKSKPVWLEDVKTEIENLISIMTSQLRTEAEYDHDEELLNEKYMYSHFKQNIEDNGYYSNWVILKYFYRMFKIKILKEIIGEYTFTQEDKEMYEYFCNFPVNEKNKCKPSILKYKSCSEENGENYIFGGIRKYKIYVEFKTDDISANNVLEIDYYDLFQSRWWAANNMIRNAKMLSKLVVNYDFFGNNCFTTNMIEEYRKTYGNDIVYSITPLLNNWEKEAKKPKNVKPEDFYAEADTFAKANPLYNKLTAERNALYFKLLEDFIKTERGKQLLDCLPAEYKVQLGV
jgi:hypothetical protein